MKPADGRAQRTRLVGKVLAAVAVLVAGIVIAVTVADISGRPDASPTPPAEPDSGVIFTAAGEPLTDGGTVPSAGFSPITVQAAGASITEVRCVVDGVYLGASNTAPYRFDVGSPAAGEHKLRCTLQDGAGGRSDVRLDFTVGAGSSATSNGSAAQVAPTSAALPAGTAGPAVPAATTGPATDQVVVSDAAGLQKALLAARPGMTITLKDGSYGGKEVKDPSGQEPGRFVTVASGTAAAPIVLQGSRQAILDGDGTGGGYALHLKGANYWQLRGFTIESASKGIVLDGSNHNVIDDVHVTDIGAEGVHFRSFSSDNLLTNSTVDNTGVDAPNYGEGVYIGSANSNWQRYTSGEPDNSDRNQVINNRITDTAAENIDIKEGTSDGVVRGNDLGGDKIASKNSADSWIDVKGNGYLIDANHGVTTPRPNTTECGDPKGEPDSAKNPFCDGFQVHVAVAGWGQDNTFTNNRLEVNAPGAGIWLQNTAVPLHNVIKCNNIVTGAEAGAYATDHYSALDCTS